MCNGLPKLAGPVGAAGDSIAWDDSAKEMNISGARRNLIGIATKAAGNGATMARVRLDGATTAAAVGGMLNASGSRLATPLAPTVRLEAGN